MSTTAPSAQHQQQPGPVHPAAGAVQPWQNPQGPHGQQGPPGPTPAGGAPAGLRGTNAARVLLVSVVATVVSVLVAVLGLLAAQAQASGMDRAAAGTDRVLTVMAVRSAILQADGAATNAFLVGGLEPQDRRAVYDQAIEQAASLLSQLAGAAGTEDAPLIASLNADLARYTSLVEAARVNNRQGFPVGAAYLDQASTLVREEMLTDLDAVLAIAADDAAADLGTTRWSILVIAVLLVGLSTLIVCQVVLARITRRRLNGGLVLATVLLLVATFVGGIGATESAQRAADLRTDAYRPTLAIAQAGVLAEEARTLESFTLIKRGSGQAEEEAFVERTQQAGDRLREASPRLAALLQTWVERHAAIRELDDSGDWDGAVALAVTDDASGPSAAYAAFSGALQDEVGQQSGEVTSDLREAGAQASFAGWVLLIAGALAAVAAWRGTGPRREEYR